jgi:hypothetical protein
MSFLFIATQPPTPSSFANEAPLHVYEVRPRYDTPLHAIGYATHSSRSHDAVIRVYDAAGNVIETHEHKGYFRKS